MDADSLLVGRYQMGRRIGAGGVGQVWSAHDTVLGREVAIKVQEIDPELDDAAFERFVREARSAAVLQHPNVVTIFDSGTDQDTAFLVMELLPGPTLTGHLAQHGRCPSRTPSPWPLRSRRDWRRLTARGWSIATSSRRT